MRVSGVAKLRVSDELGKFFGNDDVRFELQRVAGEEVAPRFELFDELHPVFHRRQILDGSARVVSHRFGHRFDAAASRVPYTADVEGVAIVVLDYQVKAAFALSPVEFHDDSTANLFDLDEV